MFKLQQSRTPPELTVLDAAERERLRGKLRAGGCGGPAETLQTAERLYREGKSSDVLLCARALQGVAPGLVECGGHREVRMFIARSVSLEPVLPWMQVEAALNGLVLRMELGGYGSFMDELLSDAGPLGRESNFDVVMLAMDLEDFAGRLPELCAEGWGEDADTEIAACVDRLRAMLTAVRSRVRSRLVVQGLVIPDRTALGDVGEDNSAGGLKAAVQRLNGEMARVCGAVSGCVYFGVDTVAARFGKGAWTDARLFLSSRVPFAAAAFPAYAGAVARVLAVLFRPARKVLCTDLDGTLWGGVLGEDGPEGIATGAAFPGNCYRAYQQCLKQLRARGVLLAIVSKNNAADVEEAFAQRADDLAVRLEDFSARRIGWGGKAAALQELAGELSLGLDSFVLVDDHPVECAAVRQALPEVAVVHVPAEEPWTFVELLQASGYFDTEGVSEADVARAEEYRSRDERRKAEVVLGSREGFLRSLEMVCSVVPATKAPLARAVQMLGKTNQFNLTTRRHGAAEVKAFEEERGGQAVALRVRDRFGDSGVVGLLLAQTVGAVCRIDTLLLSCRVIGRDIERVLLAEAARRGKQDGARWLLGEFRPTRKNAPAANFYAGCGFVAGLPAGFAVPFATGEDSVWSWYDLEWGLPAVPEFLGVREVEDEGTVAGVVA